jgi:hypothetical protein
MKVLNCMAKMEESRVLWRQVNAGCNLTNFRAAQSFICLDPEVELRAELMLREAARTMHVRRKQIRLAMGSDPGIVGAKRFKYIREGQEMMDNRRFSYRLWAKPTN